MKVGKVIRSFSAKDGRRVVLRTPKWEDLDDLLELINSLVEEGAEIIRNVKVSREEEIEWLSKTLADLEKDEIFVLVAEVDGKVIASSDIRTLRGFERHVYEKVGFMQRGTIPKKHFKDGKYIDEIIMTKILE